MNSTREAMGIESQAVVFPGQGAQRAGMGIDFFEAFEVAQRVFLRARAVLPFDVLELCRGGDPRFDLTAFTQPCLLTAETAMFEVLRREFGVTPTLFGGHSLGEYTALVAAGVLPLEVALELVHLRGTLMQDAVPAGQGGMAALSMPELPLELVAACAAEHEVDVANINSPAQVVLSGEAVAVDRVVALLLERLAERGLRATKLAVSAPFHSRHMRPVLDPFRAALERVRPHISAATAARVVCNHTGGFYEPRVQAVIDALAGQLTGSVQWLANMRLLAAASGDILEIGPHRPLTGFFRAIDVAVRPVIDLRSARRLS